MRARASYVQTRAAEMKDKGDAGRYIKRAFTTVRKEILTNSDFSRFDEYC